MSPAARIKTPVVLPEVTEQHRRAAFEAMAWTGWTFEQAMANDTRRRCIEARAHQLRKAMWLAGRVQVQRPPQFDAKRAAAGDFDD